MTEPDPILVEIRDLLRELVDAQPRLAYDVRSASRLLSVGETTLRAQVRAGLIRKVPHLGDRVIIPASELERRVSLGEVSIARAS